MEWVKAVALTHNKVIQRSEVDGKAEDSVIFRASPHAVPDTPNKNVSSGDEGAHRPQPPSQRWFSTAVPLVTSRPSAEFRPV